MKLITENLALLTVAALALGLFRLFTFYNAFGIDILQFIDPSEILQTQFFSILGVIVAVSFIFLMSVPFFDKSVKFSKLESIKAYFEGLSNFQTYGLFAIFLVGITVVFMCGGSLSRMDADNIISGKHLRKVVLLLNKGYIVTDTTLVYVGKTKNYVFVYNRKTEVSSVIKMENIKEIKIYRRSIR
jgi:hypothetical protein